MSLYLLTLVAIACPAIATAVEGNGGAIANITDDYDGDTRNATTPDIGADEINGTPLPCAGAVGGTITPLTVSICTSNTVATLTASGATTGGGITYQWMVSATSGSGYVSVTGGTGANSVIYTTPAGMAQGTYYYVLQVTCSVGPVSAFSSEVAFTVKHTT